MVNDVVIPKNLEAERAVISIILLDPERLVDVVDRVEVADFYDMCNQEIWRTIKSLYQQGTEIDIVSIKTEIRRQNIDYRPAMEQISSCYENPVMGGNLETFIAEVKNKAILREIIRITSNYLENASLNEARASNLLGEIDKEIIALSEKVRDIRGNDSQSIINELRKDIAKGKENKWRGYETGLRWLDDQTGGLMPTHCWVVGAYCMGKGTKIVMWDSNKKNIEDIKVGDLLSPVNSKSPRRVLKVTEGQDDMYEVSGKYIDTFSVNKEHILPLMWVGDTYNYKRGGIYYVPIKDFIKKSKREKKGFRLCKGVGIYKRPEKKLFIPPYLLGLWLGDGNRTRAVFSVSYKEKFILDYLRDYAIKERLNYSETDYKKDGVLTVAISDNKGGDAKLRTDNLFCKLRSYGLLGNKHIPLDYFQSSIKERLELLAGLIDTDGSISGFNRTVVNFTNADYALILQVKELAESLGFNTKLKKWKQKKSQLIKKWKEFIIYRLSITGNTYNIPVKIPRKRAIKTGFKNIFYNDTLGITFNVKYLGKGKYYGFKLDGNSLYLAQNFIINHNTGTGKTFIILQMLLNVLKQGGKVILFSTEMDRKMNMLRALGNLAGIGTLRMLKGSLTDEEHSQIKMASDTLEAYKDGFLIYDNVYTVEEIRLKCKKQKIQKGLDVVAVDFIQNLRGAENIYERMSNAAIGLQQIAQELSITMIIASQVTQGGAGWVNKEAIEYKGAGEIAAIADVAIWLQRVKEDRSARAIILRKVRHGVPGKMTVRISFPSGKIIDMLEGEEGEDVAREQLAQGGV